MTLPLRTAASFALVPILSAFAPSASAQAYPPISARTFTGGSITVTVTGAVSIREEVQMNGQASFSDGTMTWIQFGNSGWKDLNALITYGDNGETGISVGRVKVIATGGIMPGGESECSGQVEVTATLISGRYRCPGLTSVHPDTGSMGKVDLTVTFTARSTSSGLAPLCRANP